jgi:hypothetical protein
MTRQSNRRTGPGQRRAAQTTRGLASLKLRHWLVLLGAGVAMIAVAVLLLGGSAATATTIKVGDCFNVPNSKDVTGVLPQSCAQPHTGELYAITTAPQSSPHPDDPEFQDVVFDVCAPAFTSYTGQQPGLGSRLTYSAFWPTMPSWQGGDRSVRCYLTTIDGAPMTKSYKAS